MAQTYPYPTTDNRLVITQGDRLNLPSSRLVDSDGNAYNLSGLTAAFRMVHRHTGVVAVANAAAQIEQNDANQATWGKVSYAWAGNDTAVPGLYQCWWIVTNADGATTHFPPDGDFWVLILPAP